MNEKLDPRLKELFDDVEKEIGLLSIDNNKSKIENDLEEKGIEYEQLDQRDNGNVTIIKYQGQTVDKEVYCAEFMVRTAIDDYMICTYQFDHKPSEMEIKTAEDIAKIRPEFKVGMVQVEFECWECGHESHVLDSSLLENYSKREMVRRVKEVAEEKCCCK